MLNFFFAHISFHKNLRQNQCRKVCELKQSSNSQECVTDNNVIGPARPVYGSLCLRASSPPRPAICIAPDWREIVYWRIYFHFKFVASIQQAAGGIFMLEVTTATQQLSLRYVRWIFNVKQMYSPFLATACDEKSNPANFEINFSLSFCSGFGNDSYTKFLVQKNPRSANCLANKCDTANKVCSAGSCRLVWVKDEWCRIGSERIPYRETQP